MELKNSKHNNFYKLNEKAFDAKMHQKHLKAEKLLGRTLTFEEFKAILPTKPLQRITKKKSAEILRKYDMCDIATRIENLFKITEKKTCDVGEIWYIDEYRHAVYISGGLYIEYFKDLSCDADILYFSEAKYAEYKRDVLFFLDHLESYSFDELLCHLDNAANQYGFRKKDILTTTSALSDSTSSIAELLVGEEVEVHYPHNRYRWC